MLVRAARRAAPAVTIAVAVSTAATVGGCGDDAGSVALVDDVLVEVDARDNAFRPEAVTVPAGAEVQWTNRGRNVHDVLPVDVEGWGAEADDFGPSATYRHRFTAPGTYPYYCSLHGTTTAGMVGVIEVTG